MIEYTLIDDGTLDTVVECYCTICENDWHERIGTAAAEYRCDDGIIRDIPAMMEQFDIYCEQCEG